jgi:hypothetical protein
VKPIHAQNSSLSAIGRIQRAVVTVVRVIGSRRLDQASTNAVNDPIHFLKFIFMASTKIIQ